MASKAKYLLLLAATLPLMGQGCSLMQSASVDTTATTPAGQVDAAIDAELDTAADVDSQERTGDADANLMNTDKAQLDSYSQTQYDLP